MQSTVNGVTNSVHGATPQAGRGATAAESRGEQPTRPAMREDEVELSELAKAQIEQTDCGAIRRELVERVRAEIASGTYLTDEKIDAAVERLREAMLQAT